MNPMLALRQYQKVNGVAQTSEASPHRLVQMLMQGGLDRIAQAKGAIARNDLAQKGILIGKAIDMVNTQTIDDARMHQFKNKAVGVVKHRRVFNPDANQAGNFKKAPPGELPGRLPPGHQPPALRLVQRQNGVAVRGC